MADLFERHLSLSLSLSLSLTHTHTHTPHTHTHTTHTHHTHTNTHTHTHFTLKKALSAIWMNSNLTILTPDKGNASVTINPSGYNLKIGAFLEEPA